MVVLVAVLFLAMEVIPMDRIMDACPAVLDRIPCIDIVIKLVLLCVGVFIGRRVMQFFA